MNTNNHSPIVGQANSEMFDNLQARCNGAQAAAHGGQGVSGGDSANAAPAHAQAAQLQWPPGTAGELAKYIYRTSPRPVPEVAIAATLGLLAGVCGRAFSISDKGLNLYILLIARSAVGKESMHKGISDLLDIAENEPVQRFADFDDFASAPALAKAVLENPCFVSVTGEIGRRFKRMSRDNDRVMQDMRTLWTNLYEKSGETDKVPGIRYSNAEDSKLGIRGAAFSLIGETTPSTFLEALTPDMAEDGFLSRFVMIEYQGDRPPLNEDRKADLICLGAWKSLLVRVLPYGNIVNAPKRTPVEYEQSGTAEQMLRNFGLECDAQINSTTDEWIRQMWNRAHMKALKVAALLACADRCMFPIIEVHHAEWALALVRRDIQTMASRISSGDVGVGDEAREKKLVSICKDYLIKPVPESYKVPPEMKRKGVIPRNYLQMRTARPACFEKHPLGPTRAMDDTIASLVKSGWLHEMNGDILWQEYEYRGKAWRIVDLPNV